MPATSRRPLLKRARLWTAAVVLLPLAYVGSWFSVSVVWWAGYVPRTAKAPLAFLYGPIAWYAHDPDLPGYAALKRLDEEAYQVGCTRFYTQLGTPKSGGLID